LAQSLWDKKLLIARYSLLICLASGCANELVVKDAEMGRVYGRWALKEGEAFSIEFVHSVNKSPVRDTFVREGRLIKPVEARYYSFGAGMPSDLSGGLSLRREGEAMLVTGFETSFKELNYIVGTVSDHLLYINNETIGLRHLCGRNAHITLIIQ
jgi:hypothetical protein